MILSRELGKRIWGGSTNIENGGGGVSSDAIAGLLAGYATETWVDEHYISIDFFSRLFQAHGTENGSEIDVMPNDMDTTITSVESMFGFWTNLYISALGSNGAAPAGISLGMLTDVVISGTPSAGQVLTFDAVTQKWVNGNATGASSLATLTDVTLTSLQNGQTLLYDSTTSKWYNSALKTINGQSLLGSGDISVGGGASGNYLPLSGGTLTGSLQIYSTGSGWNEGLRMHIAPDGWCGVVMCGSDNTGVSGTSPLTWSLHNNDGHFYLVNNGSNTYTYGLDWTNMGSLNVKTSGASVNSSTNGNVFWLSSSATYACISYQASVGTIWSVGSNSHSFYFWNTSQQVELLNISNAGDVLLRSGNHFAIGTPGGAGTNANAGYFSAGPGYSIGSGRYGLRLLVCDQSDAQTGLGQDLVTPTGYSNAYNLCIAGGNSSSNVGYISFVTHTVNSTSYRYLGGFYDNAGSVLFQIMGTIYATGAITALSDARKKDITGEAGVTVEQIAHAPAVQFLWKDKERRKDGVQVGTLAQYWQTVLPEVVSDKGGELSMQYGVAALVSAIVTARKVVDHERRIHELEKENERLKEEISQLRLLN